MIMAFAFDDKARKIRTTIAELEIAVEVRRAVENAAQDRLKTTMAEAKEVLDRLPFARALGWRRRDD